MTSDDLRSRMRRMFFAQRGVPRALLCDNLETGVPERQGDPDPRLLELANHFAVKLCAPPRGNEKGKVERTMRYLRDSFFDARSCSSVEDLNTQLAETVAPTRGVPTDPEGRGAR
jgi:transposase